MRPAGSPPGQNMTDSDVTSASESVYALREAVVMDPKSSSSTELFMKLLLANRRRIFALTTALVPNASDADDVMQETSARMWRNFDKFEPGTDFAAWAAAFVRFSALNFYRKRDADMRVIFNDELVELIADEMSRVTESIDPRLEALRRCVQRMPKQSRLLIELRYESGSTMKSVAEQLGRSVAAIYKAMSRIHQALVQCVEDSIAAEGKA